MPDYKRVFFLPFVGNEYHSGGLRGRKVLLVGESHYDEWETDGAITKKDLEPTFTQECILEHVNGDGGSRFWNRVRYRLGGEELRGKPANVFWSKVAFYNFIQSPVSGGARVRPTGDQWAVAAPAFLEVLTKLRPDRVWIIGRELWRHIPARQGKGPDITVEGATIPLEWFTLEDGQKAFVTATPHPASSLFVRELAPALAEFVHREFGTDGANPGLASVA